MKSRSFSVSIFSFAGNNLLPLLSKTIPFFINGSPLIYYPKAIGLLEMCKESERNFFSRLLKYAAISESTCSRWEIFNELNCCLNTLCSFFDMRIPIQPNSRIGMIMIISNTVIILLCKIYILYLIGICKKSISTNSLL